MLAGFEVPTEGAILLEGEPVEKVPPYKRDVNMVFQSYALFEHLDVADNVAFGLKRRKVAPAEIEPPRGRGARARRLSERAQARTNELSGGQRQRVALARALVNRPKVLLLDEPLGALDLKLRKQMQVELKAIQREVGITFLYVTHDQEEALAMSDRIAVMDDGVVAQCGTPEEVYEHPARPFVAGFIGISNLMEGVVEDGGVRLGSAALCAGAGARGTARAGDAVHLSVRPGEDLARRARGRDGPARRGRSPSASTSGTTHADHRRARAGTRPRRARAEHARLPRRRPLGDRPAGHARRGGRSTRACCVRRRRRRRGSARGT